MKEELGPRLAQRLAVASPAKATQVVAEVLAELRPMHPAGALAVVLARPELVSLARRRQAFPLARRLQELATAQECLACGTCCRTSSPTLYRRDLPLVQEGHIPRAELVTLRAGERVYSHRLRRSLVLEQELIKLAEHPQGGCVFLEDHRCAIYPHRPLQCRHLECWSGRHAGQLEDLPRLDRLLIYQRDELARTLVAEYELKLPAAQLARVLAQAAAGDPKAEERALELMDLDHRLRQGICARYGYPPQELTLLWGRSVVEVAAGYGLRPQVEGDRLRLVRG